jgi:major membrane immunogen (membrane-anchored lipoprotein)
MPQRVKCLLAVLPTTVLLVGCGGQDTPVEQAEEEAGVEEVQQAPPRDEAEAKSDEAKKKAAEQGAKATPFKGEHENLQPGDTAEWNAGMQITISDVYTAPNAIRRNAEERKAKADAAAKAGKGEPKGGPEPALQGPERLIGLTYTITNEGEMPVNFNGELPCTALDSNGLEFRGGGALTAEQLGGVYKALEVHE